jgi:co-chaperonin GroES (HSP10)
MRVLGKKIAVKVPSGGPTQTASGLYIAGTADASQVVKGVITALGSEAEVTLTAGDVVHFNKFTAPEVTVGTEKFHVLTVDDVLLVE